jgi:hypothetical protein
LDIEAQNDVGQHPKGLIEATPNRRSRDHGAYNAVVGVDWAQNDAAIGGLSVPPAAQNRRSRRLDTGAGRTRSVERRMTPFDLATRLGRAHRTGDLAPESGGSGAPWSESRCCHETGISGHTPSPVRLRER